MRLDVVFEPEWERRGEGRGETILQVGGLWDRKEHDWAPELAAQARVLTIHAGQIEPYRFFVRWMRAYIAGEKLEPPVYSVGLVGGRRGAKTTTAMEWPCLFAVAVPDSIVWIVTQVHEEDEGDEVQRNLAGILPSDWYVWRDYKSTFELVNGSRIMLKSAYQPSRLKKGRADFVVLNEAQLMSHQVYVTIRAPIADKRGLVVIAANPPDEPIGHWVDDYVEETRAGLRQARVFELDPMKNPTIDHAALESMRSEVDDRTFRREVLGEFLPREDVAFWAYAPRDYPNGNVINERDLGAERTEDFLRRELGRPFEAAIGVDFNLVPHMAGMLYRFFDDPEDPNDVLMVVCEEFVLEQADEDDLVDAFEEFGLDPKRTALIPDATGQWQRPERKAGLQQKLPPPRDIRGGRGSWDVFRRRGWIHLYAPDREMKTNPQVVERVKATNARWRSADGRRHLFVISHLERTLRACKMWEMKNGVPARRSPHAHIGDALSYPVWRFYPRRLQRRHHKAAVETMRRASRARQFEGVF